MPVSARGMKNLWVFVTAFAGVLLLFTVVPFLNVGLSTQIVPGFSLSTIFGLLLLVFAYQYHRGHA